MNQHNFLKSFTKHDEQLLSTMTHMIETHPNAKVTMASFNVINVEGDGLGEFLQELVNQVPVLNMRTFKIKKSTAKHRQVKHEIVDSGVEEHSVMFTFHDLL